MIHPSDLVCKIAAGLALQQFPHKEWNTMTDEEKGYYVQDVFEFLAVLRRLNFTISEVQQL